MKNFHLPIKLSRLTFIKSSHYIVQRSVGYLRPGYFSNSTSSAAIVRQGGIWRVVGVERDLFDLPETSRPRVKIRHLIFYLSQSFRSGAGRFLSSCVQLRPISSESEERMTLVQAVEKKSPAREFRVLCTRELPENEIKTSLSNKSTIPGFSCLHAPWHRYVPTL